MTYLYGIAGDFQADLLETFAEKTGLAAPRVDVRDRFWYNPRLETNKNLVTGLVAFVLMIVAVIAISPPAMSTSTFVVSPLSFTK